MASSECKQKLFSTLRFDPREFRPVFKMMDPIDLEEQDIDDEMDEEEEEEEEEDGPKFIDASVPGYTFVPVSFSGEDASSGEEEEIRYGRNSVGLKTSTYILFAFHQYSFSPPRPPQTSSPGSTGSSGSGMEQKHRCAICKSFFLSAAHLESHIETSHKNKCAWTCQHCSAIFSDVEMFKLHLMKQHKVWDCVGLVHPVQTQVHT